MEFVRGRYKLNNYRSVENLFEQMFLPEINFLVKNNFEKIWQSIWINKNKNNEF